MNDHYFTLNDIERPDDDTIDLLALFRVLNRHKAAIAALGLLSSVVAALWAYSLTDIYQATATLIVEQDRRNIVSIEEVIGFDGARREYYNTQLELLQSRNLAERVIEALDLANHPEFRPTEQPQGLAAWMDKAGQFAASLMPRRAANGQSAAATPAADRAMNRLVDEFAGRLAVLPRRDTELIEVSFEAEDPRLAAQIANSLVSEYVEADLELRVEASQQANRFLSNRLESLRENLRVSEANLQAFLEREELVDIQGVETLKIRELEDLNMRAIAARRQRADLEVIYRQVRLAGDADTDALMNFPAVLNHPLVSEGNQRVDALNQEIAQLSNRYGRNHPSMISLRAELDSVTAELTRQIAQVVEGIENEYDNARTREEELDAVVEQTSDELLLIRSKNFELRELQREADTNKQLFDLFFNRFRETSETEQFQSAQAYLVDPAVPTSAPIKPQRRLIVALAALFGVGFGVALTLLRNFLDNTVKTPGDVEDKLQQQTLGVLPLVKQAQQGRGKAKRLFLGMVQDEHSTFSESVRTIRTAITLSSIDSPLRVIAVTSSIPNEGKSTVAANLALAMGRLPKKVLLIDTDLRRPSLARSIEFPPNAPGLVEYMAGNASYQQCIYRYKAADIYVMPVGQIPPNPLELISSQKFAGLLEELKNRYELIILDTPPTQAVSDALVLGALADACIYVVKAESTSAASVRNGLKRMAGGGAKILGVVLNQIVARKDSAYYYQGYYDSYGYGRYGGKPASDP